MKRLILVIWTAVFTSCGLVSKYQDNQHSVYAKILTPEEKTLINQKGEILKVVEFNNPKDNSLLKGMLRIIKTEKPDIFNFVEIGLWVEHGRIGSSGKDHNLEFKDTTINDSLGNSLSRVVYYKDKLNEYTLGERWTTMQIDNSLIRYIEIFKDKVLISEYFLNLVDFEKSKSDLQKEKISIGTRKDYSSSGQLISTKTYDENGKLLSEERYGR